MIKQKNVFSFRFRWNGFEIFALWTIYLKLSKQHTAKTMSTGFIIFAARLTFTFKIIEAAGFFVSLNFPRTIL